MSYNNKKTSTRKQNTNTKRVPDNVFEAPLLVESTTDNTYEEVLEILSSTKFEKISIPLNAYKSKLDDTNPDDTKITTIGYIKSFDKTKDTFTFVVFNAFKDKVKEWTNASVEAKYTVNKDKSLKTIIKFILG